MASQSRNAPLDKATNDAIQSAINRALANLIVATVDGQPIRGKVEFISGSGVKLTVQGNKIVLSAR